MNRSRALRSLTQPRSLLDRSAPRILHQHQQISNPKAKPKALPRNDSTQQDPYHPTLFTTYLHRARRNLYDRIQQSSAPASSRLSSVRPFQICASSVGSLESASASAGSTTSQNSLASTPRRLDEVSRHVFSQRLKYSFLKTQKRQQFWRLSAGSSRQPELTLAKVFSRVKIDSEINWGINQRAITLHPCHVPS